MIFCFLIIRAVAQRLLTKSSRSRKISWQGFVEREAKWKHSVNTNAFYKIALILVGGGFMFEVLNTFKENDKEGF